MPVGVSVGVYFKCKELFQRLILNGAEPLSGYHTIKALITSPFFIERGAGGDSRTLISTQMKVTLKYC